MRAGVHQVGDGSPIARALDHEIADERDRLGMVELDAPIEPLARDHGRHGDQQLVLFTRRELHVLSSAEPVAWQGAQIPKGPKYPYQQASERVAARRHYSSHEDGADHARTSQLPSTQRKA